MTNVLPTFIQIIRFKNGADKKKVISSCLANEDGFADLAVELPLLGRVHGLVLLEAGERVIGPVTGLVVARVNSLPGIVDLLVVLEVVLPSEGSATDAAGERLVLGVD